MEEENALVDTGSDLKLRLVRDNELKETQRLIDLEESWNLTFARIKMMKEIFDTVFVAVNKEGEVAGTLSIVPTHDNECVLCNFVVAANYRGQGLGRRMLTEIQQIYTGKVMTLISVPQAPGFYRKCGMQIVEPPMDVITMEVNVAEIENRLCQRGEIIVKPYATDDFEELCHYDRNLRGYDMPKHLSVMVGTSHMFVARSRPCGNVTGYAAGFQKKSTLIVDGCYADNDDIALHLFWNILRVHPESKTVKLQIIQPRIFLTTFGKLSQSSCCTCYRFANGTVPPTSLKNLYAAKDWD